MSEKTSHWSLDSSALGSTSDLRQSLASGTDKDKNDKEKPHKSVTAIRDSLTSVSTGVAGIGQEAVYHSAANVRQIDVPPVVTGTEHRPESRSDFDKFLDDMPLENQYAMTMSGDSVGSNRGENRDMVDRDRPINFKKEKRKERQEAAENRRNKPNDEDEYDGSK